ncbi:MAG: hypothetical protein DRI90_23385 [Deltaproteobacteria bacterium]|nr:MAG: hypothetical protein DRI90_23385 [Deltaproteobacteria bacterium]
MVWTAQDGMEALDLVRTEGLDVVVSDLAMPRLGGYDLFLRLQDEAPDLSRRIVFMTGGSVPVALQGKTCTVLSKPIDLHALDEALGRALHQGSG